MGDRTNQVYWQSSLLEYNGFKTKKETSQITITQVCVVVVFSISVFCRMRRHCGASCAGGSSGFQEETTYTGTCTHAAAATQLGKQLLLTMDVVLHFV